MDMFSLSCMFKNLFEKMILNDGSKIYFIEYLDHGRTPDKMDESKKKPLTLWCCGYIVNEDEEDEEYIALISMGSRFRNSKPKMYNYILKRAITKKFVIHIVGRKEGLNEKEEKKAKDDFHNN